MSGGLNGAGSENFTKASFDIFVHTKCCRAVGLASMNFPKKQVCLNKDASKVRD